MSKITLLIFDISDRERCESMVNAFEGYELDVYFYKNGAFRLCEQATSKVGTIPKFDLIIQHRNDPLPDDIKFKYRVWYGGGKQTKTIKKKEAVIYRPIPGKQAALSKAEARQILDFFFTKGAKKPAVLEEFPPQFKQIELINEFLKFCSAYTTSQLKTQTELKAKIKLLKKDLSLNSKNAIDTELIKALDMFQKADRDVCRETLKTTIKPKLLQRCTRPTG